MSAKLAILVIDDNQDDRILYGRSLQEAMGDAVSVLEAGSGESGLTAIEKYNPQCVLLDYSLPGHNGIVVLRRIRAKYPYLPVIMLTGQGNEAIAVQSMKEGAQDYIAKNIITPESLQRVVTLAVEHGAMQKNIHEQRASLEIFTRALAHDLKEPVRTIRSFIDMIEDWQSLCAKSQRALGYIRKAADRMDALIDTVHLYTRLDAAEQMEQTACDLADVLQEVQDNLSQLIYERNAKIYFDALPRLHANRVQMIQLFQNLLTNAIRHSDTPVTIWVSASEQADRWQIVVRDNGPGIAPECLEKIFDPFKRLSHRKEDGPGLGLGLAINRKIVESHGGKIWCELPPGGGACFLCTLPKAANAAATRSTAFVSVIEPAQGHPTRTLARLLLVDDNEADLELNRIMLTEHGKLHCEMLSASSGREALAMLQEAAQEHNPIDLVLLDINMPGMSGFELMTEMRKESAFSDTLVVLCSTSAYDVDKRTAAALGAAGYLTKPPQFSLLTEIIEQSGRLHLRQQGDSYALLRAA